MSHARLVSDGAGPPGVVRTRTKCCGLRTSASAAAEYSMAWPRTSFDTSPGACRAARRVALRFGDEARRDRVAPPERHAVIARERVGQLGDGDPALPGALRQPLPSNCAVAIAAATSADGADRVLEHRADERLQIVLGVDDVAERRVVDAVRIALACPSALLAIARACSSATGFRFCGMMLLHCTKPSASRR